MERVSRMRTRAGNSIGIDRFNAQRRPGSRPKTAHPSCRRSREGQLTARYRVPIPDPVLAVSVKSIKLSIEHERHLSHCIEIVNMCSYPPYGMLCTGTDCKCIASRRDTPVTAEGEDQWCLSPIIGQLRHATCNYVPDRDRSNTAGSCHG